MFLLDKVPPAITAEDVELKLTQLSGCYTALDHLIQFVEYKEKGNSHAAMESYRNAYFALDSTTYSAESFGLDSSCLDSRIVDMESEAVYIVLGKIFGVVLILIAFFINFISTGDKLAIKPISAGSVPVYGHLSSADKILSELKKSLAMLEDAANHMEQSCIDTALSATKMFTSVDVFFKCVLESKSDEERTKASEAYKKEVTVTNYAHHSVAANDALASLSGLYVISEHGEAVVVFNHGFNLDHDALLQLDKKSAQHYETNKKLVDTVRYLRTRHPLNKFIRVQFSKQSGPKVDLTLPQRVEAWETSVAISKRLDKLGKDISEPLANLKIQINKCEELEKRLAKKPDTNQQYSILFRTVAKDLSLTTKILHDSIKRVVQMTRVLKPTILRVGAGS